MERHDRFQQPTGRARPLHIDFRLADINPMRFIDLILLGLALDFIFGGGMLESSECGDSFS